MRKKEMIIRHIIESVGGLAFWIGLIGIGNAIETGNGFLASAIVLSVGIGSSLWIFNR